VLGVEPQRVIDRLQEEAVAPGEDRRDRVDGATTVGPSGRRIVTKGVTGSSWASVACAGTTDRMRRGGGPEGRCRFEIAPVGRNI